VHLNPVDKNSANSICHVRHVFYICRME